ncbi:rhomboid family intramembrane serine protease [Nocardioides rubriscoriae]|uniref:rhomboid family intramembrane serine protease n=1 Tax=Nocardioides rubriscoriae TaxID=642762 RepID=UPI001B86A498|nr:rhomboid family intramembrane serine protease [Nocardioides rubriscoriae]
MSTERRSPWLTAGIGAVGFVALLWLIEVVDALVGHRLDQYGVHPRTDEGLLGIVLAPLLHGGWLHLEANTVPTLVLLFLVLVSGLVRGLQATALIWLVGGVGLWLVAPSDTVHLGASVLIFGWFVYLLLRGFWNRSAGQVLLGVALFLVYGSLLLGVLPGEPGISWQGHLFGAVGGGLAAFLLAERGRPARPVA